MVSKKVIWNAIVILALLFLVFMFGFNYHLNPIAQFAAIPTPPVISHAQFREIKLETLSSPEQDELSLLKKIPASTLSTRVLQAKSNAVAWVIQIQVGASSSAILQKLQEQKITVFTNPVSAAKATAIYVGPFTQRKEAEQVAKSIKNTFGFAGDVVKFDPLTM